MASDCPCTSSGLCGTWYALRGTAPLNWLHVAGEALPAAVTVVGYMVQIIRHEHPGSWKQVEPMNPRRLGTDVCCTARISSLHEGKLQYLRYLGRRCIKPYRLVDREVLKELAAFSFQGPSSQRDSSWTSIDTTSISRRLDFARPNRPV
jgi:hypothetical protein